MKLPKVLNYIDHESTILFKIDTPEKELLAAVIVRAIQDYLSPNDEPLGRYDYHSNTSTILPCEEWLFDVDNGSPHSIMWILNYISSDAESAHQTLMKLLTNNTTRKSLRSAFLRST